MLIERGQRPECWKRVTADAIFDLWGNIVKKKTFRFILKLRCAVVINNPKDICSCCMRSCLNRDVASSCSLVRELSVCLRTESESHASSSTFKSHEMCVLLEFTSGQLRCVRTENEHQVRIGPHES